MSLYWEAGPGVLLMTLSGDVDGGDSYQVVVIVVNGDGGGCGEWFETAAR